MTVYLLNKNYYYYFFQIKQKNSTNFAKVMFWTSIYLDIIKQTLF